MAPRRVDVTRPDKILWPALDITKRAFVDYVGSVADRMLPWLHDRPLTVIRAPDGVDGQRYFQKDTPKYAPHRALKTLARTISERWNASLGRSCWAGERIASRLLCAELFHQVGRSALPARASRVRNRRTPGAAIRRNALWISSGE